MQIPPVGSVTGLADLAPAESPSDPAAVSALTVMTTERAPLNLEALAQIIESERVELLQVHAMLRCLCEVLLYSDDDNASMHADVAKLTARLIQECVERLEKMVARLKAEAGSSG